MKRIVGFSFVVAFTLGLMAGCEKKVETPKNTLQADPNAVTIDKEKGKVTLPPPPKDQ